jgi:hypothetical protein
MSVQKYPGYDVHVTITSSTQEVVYEDGEKYPHTTSTYAIEISEQDALRAAGITKLLHCRIRRTYVRL